MGILCFLTFASPNTTTLKVLKVLYAPQAWNSVLPLRMSDINRLFCARNPAQLPVAINVNDKVTIFMAYLKMNPACGKLSRPAPRFAFRSLGSVVSTRGTIGFTDSVMLHTGKLRSTTAHS